MGILTVRPVETGFGIVGVVSLGEEFPFVVYANLEAVEESLLEPSIIANKASRHK